MGHSFVRRWLAGGALLLASVFFISRWAGGGAFAWGVLAGGAWNLLNILLLSGWTTHLFHPRERSIPLLVLFTFLKFPLLYGIGFLVLKLASLPASGVFVGVSVPLLFVFLQAITRTGGALKMRKIYG